MTDITPGVDGERPPDEIHGSFFAIVPEWILSEPGDVVKLYALLDRHANKHRRVWPGQAELAQRLGCSDRQVRRYLTRLRELGALEVIKRRYNGTTVYVLHKDPVGHRSPQRPDQGVLSVQSDRTGESTLTGPPSPPNESHLTRAIEPSEAGASVTGRRSKAKPAFTPEADRVARAEWERRSIKPVCGFPAMRARVQDALSAGYTAEQVSSVLPRMSVFSRNAFDMALGGIRSTGPPSASMPRANTPEFDTEEEFRAWKAAQRY